jgi:hypothetical protein
MDVDQGHLEITDVPVPVAIFIRKIQGKGGASSGP